MKTLPLFLVAIPLIFTLGCDNMNHSEQNVLSGAALGTIGGAALGALSGRAGEGAIIGGAVGAVGGAMQDSDRYQRGYYDSYNEYPVVEEYYVEDCPPGYYCEY